MILTRHDLETYDRAVFEIEPISEVEEWYKLKYCLQVNLFESIKKLTKIIESLDIKITEVSVDEIRYNGTLLFKLKIHSDNLKIIFSVISIGTDITIYGDTKYNKEYLSNFITYAYKLIK